MSMLPSIFAKVSMFWTGFLGISPQLVKMSVYIRISVAIFGPVR